MQIPEFRVDGIPPRFQFAQLRGQRSDVASGLHGSDKPRNPLFHVLAFPCQGKLLVPRIIPFRRRHHLFHRLFGQRVGFHRVQYRLVHVLGAYAQRVCATRAVVPTLVTHVIGVTPFLVVGPLHDHAAATHAAHRQSREQILRFVFRRTPMQATTGESRGAVFDFRPSRLDTLPEVFRHNPQVFHLGALPLALGTRTHVLLPPTIFLLRLAPHTDAVIAFARQHGADRGGAPAGRYRQALFLILLRLKRFRRGSAFLFQALANGLQTEARIVEHEDTPHHRGLLLVDNPLDVGAQRPTVGVDAIKDIHIAIPELAPSGDTSGLGQSSVGLGHEFATVFAGSLFAVSLQRANRLIHGVFRRQGFPVGREDFDACFCQLLDVVVRLVRLAAEASGVPHNEHLKRRSWLERRHHAHKTGTTFEFRTTHLVIHIHVGVDDGPARLCPRIGAALVFLLLHGEGFFRNPLFRGFPGVNCGYHSLCVLLHIAPFLTAPYTRLQVRRQPISAD